MSSVKDERLEIRLTRRERALLDEAAKLRRVSVSAFLLEVAVPHAQEVVEQSRDAHMSARAYERFLAELDRPAESVPELVELFRRPRRIQLG